MRKIVSPSPKDSPKDASGAYTKALPVLSLGEFTLEKVLFDKQLKFVTDPRPFKIAVCSRRAGKTVACAADLIHTALGTPGVVCLYITLSRNNAKKLIWQELIKLNRDYQLGGSLDLTELSISFSNGSIVYCSGAKDASEIEKFRGLALKLCYIDECQSFRDYIAELVDDIISPALLDYAGTLCLIGTPGPIPAGFFAEVAGVVPDKAKASEAWSKHGWTFFDNPFLEKKSGKTHQELLDRELRRRGVKSSDPSIQREFFGRWVLDSNSLWIKYDRDINHYQALPEPGQHKWNYILGIDLGYEDADALAVIAWATTTPIIYLVEELVINRQGLSELVAQIQSLGKTYDFTKMVIDEGGLGKKLAEEMRRRHHIPVQAADKARKQENVAFLNDALRTSRFMAKSASKFAQDCNLVEIDRSKSKPDKVVLSTKYHSDIIDAVLYAFKESPAFTFQAELKKPKVGSKEWAEQQTDDMWNAAVSHFESQAELERKFNGFNE